MAPVSGGPKVLWVIFNPASNRGRAARWRERIEQALKQADLPFRLSLSQKPGDPIRLAQAAVEQGATCLVAAGGDGTVGEVVNGIARALGYEAERWPALGILPLGSANDLAANLGLPQDPIQAVQVLARPRMRPMDVLQVNEWAFVNNAALGMEPRVTLLEKRIRRVHGVLRYVLAAFWVLARPQHWQAEMHWEGGAYRGPVTLVSVGNFPRTGGAFYPTPHADGFDGRLTFMFGYVPSRLRVVRLLLQAMRPEGAHVQHPAVHEVHSPWLRVRLAPPSPMHADGEIRTTGGQGFDFRTWPGRIPICLDAAR